jgi:hypothetical protein
MDEIISYKMCAMQNCGITLKVIFLGDFSFVRIFLKNYRVTMTTTLDTSCSENTMVLSARRGFLHACIF